jgi:hypothetical protein
MMPGFKMAGEPRDREEGRKNMISHHPRNAASLNHAVRTVLGRRSRLQSTTTSRGAPLSELTGEGLVAFRNSLPVIQTFVDLLMPEALTRQGQPKKGKLGRIITEEYAEECWAEAIKRHGK